ncbi:MAG: DNA recombination protein RmuC [Pseudomonadota bacterium]
MNFTLPINQPALTFGETTISWGDAMIAAVVVLGFLLAMAVIIAWRNGASQRRQMQTAQMRAEQAEARVSDVLQAQSEMQGRLTSIADMFGARQSEMSNTLDQRLDAMTLRLGQSMSEQQRSTHENLSQLKERLAVIDTAQNNIRELAGQVVELQSILSNKQTRGAFGQGRMEVIIEDGLPMGAYAFQTTLTNGNRPDCVVAMPNDAPGLVIDAKFPLESWNAIRNASSPDIATAAAKRFRNDMAVHIKDISSKYLIAGETQDTAFLFVPSESIFADLHEHHETTVQLAHKHRIVIVSPSLLMLSIQVIQALLKDARMREQAHLIQHEVARLIDDIGRLDDRVHKLQTHFGQANKDIDDILISTGKISKRGQKIEDMEFDNTGNANALPAGETPQPAQKPKPAAESKTGQLRLRVLEGDASGSSG